MALSRLAVNVIGLLSTCLWFSKLKDFIIAFYSDVYFCVRCELSASNIM
jgi:hypothetical protein